MEKKKLYLLTTAFPYGTGEKTFIGPELPHLQENFRVTIISGATERDLNDKADRTGLDPEISLFHIDTVVTRLPDKLWGGLRAAFSPVFLEEAFHIIRSGKQVGGRLHWALAYLTAAFRFRDGVLSAGIADGSEDSICYSYWYDLHMLGMLLSRRRFPRMKFVTRAHGADLYNERAEYSWQPFRSFMDRHLDRVFFISEAGRRYYIDHFTHREDPLRYRVCRLGLPEFGKTAPSGTAPSGGTEAETDSRRKNSFLGLSAVPHCFP
jgi:colanic acid/amylovoran biosynthesis glycosyltransferase